MSIAMTVEERAECLRWPDVRVCGWDECPWPDYCCDCHGVAWAAMWDARMRLIGVLTNSPHERVKRILAEIGTYGTHPQRQSA